MKLKKLLVFTCCFFLATFIFAQQRNISGNVSDAGGGLPGVNIIVKGTSNGVESDFNGNYSIKANAGDVLVFSFVGMKTKEVVVGNSSSVNVIMESDNLLQEVIVTALGIERRPDEITSASKVVKAAQLNQAKAPNAVLGLVGKVSGLQITTADNGVNPNTRIVLRGNRSLTGNNEALIVIDGVVSNAAAYADLNPEIVESVNVMKGASGAALYGKDGANGVIIITTKRGAGDEKFKVTFNTTLSVDNIAFLPERQTRFGQGYQGELDFTENTNWGPELDGSLQQTGIGGDFYTYEARKDNIKDFFDTGVTTLNSLSVSAGDKDGYLAATIGYQDTKGTIPGDVFDKKTLNFKAGKTYGKLSVDGNFFMTTSRLKDVGRNVYFDLLNTPINIPVSKFRNSGNDKHWTYWSQNPWWIVDNVRDYTEREKFEFILGLNYKFNDNISLTYRGSMRKTNLDFFGYDNGYQFDTIYYGTDMSFDSQYDAQLSSARRYYSDLVLNFDYQLNEDIGLKANIGNNLTDIKSKRLYVLGNNLSIPGFYNINNISGNIEPGDDGNETGSRERQVALFANLDFQYKDYLTLNITGRNDWTSVLSKNNQSIFYPSVGMSFIPTKAFPKLKSDVLSYAKVTASWVKVGNAVVPPYLINDLYVAGTGYPINGNNSFQQSNTFGNTDLRNEFSISKEFTTRLEFFKGRITLDAEYYQSDNKDQVVRITPSTTSGATSGFINVGETETEGFAIDLGLTPIKLEDFSWKLNASIARNKTTVVKVTDELKQVQIGDAINGAGVFAVEGEEFPLIKGSGFKRDSEGRVVVDANGNPIIEQDKVLGKTNPDYTLGLNTTIKYKNFNLSATFDYRTGHQFYSDIVRDQIRIGASPYTAINGRDPFVFPNSSYEVGGNFVANTNRPINGGVDDDLQNYYQNQADNVNELAVLDATAFKCREIALSYTFDKEQLSNSPFSSLSLGVNGRNLFMILPEENRTTDPEFSAFTGNNVGLGAFGQGAPTRSFGFNVNVTF